MTFYNQASHQGNVYLTGADGQDQDQYDFVSPSFICMDDLTSLKPFHNYQTSSEYCNPLGYSPQSPSKPSDWVSAPPVRPATPYLEPPLSNIGVSQDHSWNPFEQSFSLVQTAINNESSVSPGNSQANAYQNGYNTGNSQDDAQSFVSLAAINETSVCNNVIEDEDIPGNAYETPLLASPTTNYQPRKLNWGSSSRRNSACSSSAKLLSPSKRRKSWDKGSHSSHTRFESESISRLRSTTQSSRQTTFSSSLGLSLAKSPSSKEDTKGRTNHNQVEKEYRTRLNGQFETLLSSLPNDDDKDGANARVSKADVLMLAKKRIVHLEREKMMLEEQRQKLQGNVQELKRRFMEVGGICMP